MNKWFERINRFYSEERWTLDMVRDGVVVGVISEEEFLEITGEDFSEEEDA